MSLCLGAFATAEFGRRPKLFHIQSSAAIARFKFSDISYGIAITMAKGRYKPQMGPILAPWTLLSGLSNKSDSQDSLRLTTMLYFCCSNYTFMVDLTPGFNRLHNEYCKTKRKYWYFVNRCALYYKFDDIALISFVADGRITSTRGATGGNYQSCLWKEPMGSCAEKK